MSQLYSENTESRGHLRICMCHIYETVKLEDAYFSCSDDMDLLAISL